MPLTGNWGPGSILEAVCTVLGGRGEAETSKVLGRPWLGMALLGHLGGSGRRPLTPPICTLPWAFLGAVLGTAKSPPVHPQPHTQAHTWTHRLT